MAEATPPEPPNPVVGRPARARRADAAPSDSWLDRPLRWQYLLLFAAFDLGLMATVATLAAISHRNQGFATVPESFASTTGKKEPAGSSPRALHDDLGILWTALPNAIFQIFSAYWAWIAGAIATRQPYVELRRGAAAKKSILLDYRATFILWRWCKALSLGHGAVGATILMRLALQYVVAPLSARLFAPQTVVLPAGIPVSFGSVFNWTALSVNMNPRSVLTTVAATLIHGADSPPWTDDEFAFRPFTTSAQPPVAEGYRLVANTTAYSAYVSCEVVTDYNMTLSLQNPGEGVINVKGTDRGCNFEQSLGVHSSVGVYLKTGSQRDCSAGAGFGRLVFTAGTYDAEAPHLLSNLSVVSCATRYQAVAGLLEVAVSPPPSSTPPAARSFVRVAGAEPDTARMPGWRSLELSLLGAVVFNPSAPAETSDFGSVVLSYAAARSPARPLAPPALIDAIARVFNGAYRVGVAAAAFDPLPEPQAGVGTLRTPVARLFVVAWVAYAVLAVLLVALIFAAWVGLRVAAEPSILVEELAGLDTMARLLKGSDLMMEDAAAKDDDIWVAVRGSNEEAQSAWVITKRQHGSGEQGRQSEALLGIEERRRG
ncbi:hypothetical protein RB595_003134 [Gaeumannomyces hyphopodioides]